jgi:PKD repeat protein
MTTRVLKLWAIGAALSATGCTLDQATPPALTGPSTFATSLVVSATPDTLVLNGQQSVVIVEARGPSGAPLANLGVHMDILVDGVVSNCGRLSLTDVTTASDGRAAVVFTTPTLPLPLPECANAAGGVTIVATPVGTNAQSGNSFSAGIRFLAPSSSSTSSVFAVNFVMTPNPGTVNVPVAFSDAGSVSPGHAIPNSGFRWNWSDGVTKVGPSVTHDFGAAGVYVVTLTVTDDIGQSGSKSALLTIN